LTNDIVQHLLDIKADIQSVSGNVSQINSQLALVYANTLTMLANQGNMLNGISQANTTLATLVSAVGGLENMLNLVLQQQGNQGAAIATLVANSNNHTTMLQNALNGINALAVDNAQQTAMIQTILTTLAALGQDVNALSATVVNGLSALQLGVANQNTILGQLLGNSNNQAATMQTILNALGTLAQNDADQNALLGTLLANSNNQVAANQTIINHLLSIGAQIDTWGIAMIAQFNTLNLTLAQQGAMVGQVLANTNNLVTMGIQTNAAIAALNLSIADLKLFIAAEIAEVKQQNLQTQATLAVLQAQNQAIALQILTLHNDVTAGFNTVYLMLQDLQDNLCCNNCGNQPSVTTTITNVYNDLSTYIQTVDNSTNLTFQQIYNACQNGIGVCGNGSNTPGGQPCMIMNAIVPVIQGGGNNVNIGNNYNWTNGSNNLQQQATNVMSGNGC
jgi:hypothetical protein